MRPRAILKRARQVGLTCVAITDHDTIQGGVEAAKDAHEFGVEVIVGTEIRTDIGDIIGLNLTEDIQEREWSWVLEAIHCQGGLVVFPHPYRDHTAIDLIGRHVDFIETWNARSNPRQNDLAVQLAGRLNKPALIGSDAHTYGEIGNACMELEVPEWVTGPVICQTLCPIWRQRTTCVISRLINRDITGLVHDGREFIRKSLTS